jgi:hypothetical protein
VVKKGKGKEPFLTRSFKKEVKHAEFTDYGEERKGQPRSVKKNLRSCVLVG